MAQASDELAGWKRVGDRLEADMTVAGCRKRGQEIIKGHCRKAPCRRWIELDLGLLEDRGFGRTDIRELEGVWRCAQMTGCGLLWEHNTYPKGVPLAAYLGRGCTVTVSCSGCAQARTYDIADLIAALKRHRAGDGNTSVLAVASSIRGPCRGCGARRWRSKLDWPVARSGSALFVKGER